jgi:glycosyltransferase involved in cell wall biosynthesis
MRLLYVHNIKMPGPEANTVNVAKMCNAFAANGAVVTLAALPSCQPRALQTELVKHYGLQHRFDVAPMPPSSARPTGAAIAAAYFISKLRPDIVYTRVPHVAWIACRMNRPTVIEVHADLSAFSKLGVNLMRHVVSHPALTGIVVISKALEQRLKQQLPDTRTPFLVAHDGADTADLTVLDTCAEPERLAIGFAGRFYAGRGLELIAELCALCPWADFHLAGGDAQTLAHFVGALPRNMIVHGAVPHSDVARLVKRWDVLIAPYQRSVYVADGRTDTAAWMSPLKVFEYMAARKPIIASDLPAIREILVDRETALLCAPDDAAAWASALNQLRDDRSLRERLAERASQKCAAHYTWNARARNILEFCRDGSPVAHSMRRHVA